jgi:hypothetical protein
MAKQSFRNDLLKCDCFVVPLYKDNGMAPAFLFLLPYSFTQRGLTETFQQQDENYGQYQR